MGAATFAGADLAFVGSCLVFFGVGVRGPPSADALRFAGVFRDGPVGEADCVDLGEILLPTEREWLIVGPCEYCGWQTLVGNCMSPDGVNPVDWLIAAKSKSRC